MSIDRAAFLEKLKDSYEYYYNIIPGDADSGLPLFLKADFHARDEGYVIIKRAKIWASESNEYVYVFSAPSFDKEDVSKCLDYALADGEPRVVPHKEHKDSYIIAVFVADVISSEAKKEIRARKFDKSYKLGLEGWLALKTAAIELERECITTNRVGSSLTKFFKKLLRSEKV
ncbi:MAG: hypothetical protein RR314_06780 [Oscillospiraceae bacterium]